MKSSTAHPPAQLPLPPVTLAVKRKRSYVVEVPYMCLRKLPILLHLRSDAPTPCLAATALQTLTCSTATTRCSTRDLSTS